MEEIFEIFNKGKISLDISTTNNKT
ncbi:hypothetical protein Gogos_010106 [Gossypium gossypioides]|uniref:Uncharacterized protein n=1 Tax=Gossypium gossypioides TaxID=34282 RepID=A0A7J9BK54_GOSGO|nr:hypothetical protein [Gossypium gossypioides]